MDIRHQFDFQTDLPVFVRSVPAGLQHIKLSGRKYVAGDHVPWQEIGIDYDIVKRFFDLKLFHHNDERSVETRVGDGLEALTKEELETLVDSINEKVKKNTTTEKEYAKHRCRQSSIRAKQIGLLRSWRRSPSGKFEAM